VRRLGHQRRREQCVNLGADLDVGTQLGEQRGVEPVDELRGPQRVRERVAQRGQFARAGRGERDAPADALEVGHRGKRGGELSPHVG
jgi:hypothetical protein